MQIVNMWEHRLGLLVDKATGKEIAYAILANLETGDYVAYMINKNGNIMQTTDAKYETALGPGVMCYLGRAEAGLHFEPAADELELAAKRRRLQAEGLKGLLEAK